MVYLFGSCFVSFLISMPFGQQSGFHSTLDVIVYLREQWVVSGHEHRYGIAVELFGFGETENFPFGYDWMVHRVFSRHSNSQMCVRFQLVQTLIEIRTNVKLGDHVGRVLEWEGKTGVSYSCFWERVASFL